MHSELKLKSRDMGYILSVLIVSRFYLLKWLTLQGFFFAILGRGPRAFQIGKISAVNH